MLPPVICDSQDTYSLPHCHIPASVDQGSAHYNLDATKLKFRTDYMSRIGQLREKYGYNSFYVSTLLLQHTIGAVLLLMQTSCR